MSKLVEGLYYTKEHEWIRLEGGTAYVGITDHAQSEMGDVVYVDCGSDGAEVTKGGDMAVIESVKAASDVLAPLSGTVVKVNDALTSNPELLNQDPYGAFIFAIEMSDKAELDEYLSVAEYKTFIGE